MDVLPNASQAPKGKPRGAEPLSQVLARKLQKGTKITADGWKALATAAKNLKMPV